MRFDTFEFVLFFGVVYALMALLSRRGWVLLPASIIFYAFAGAVDTVIFGGVIFANWIASQRHETHRYALPTIVALNLLNLAYFKYRVFVAEGLGVPTGWEAGGSLPLGISFYTFQLIAYQVDVARGRFKVVRSPWLFVLFIAFFAHMIAGPILRARELVPQLARGLRDRFRRTRLRSYGLSLCLAGLMKKVIFADALAEPVAVLFSQTPSDVALAWLGAWLFAFQIYFDFSGYSDIAVGTAYLLGIHLPFNFRTPYLSRDPQEFWRRWHITLSTWIRDYLYIPLGGSRVGGPFRQIMVLVAVMALAGLWHGAGWQFVLWGFAWGLYLALWRWVRVIFTMFGPVQWLLHMAIVTVLWVLFRSPDLTQALDYLAVMFGAGPNGWAIPSLAASNAWWVILGSALLVALHWGEHAVASRSMLWKLRTIDGPILWGFLAALSILVLMMPRLLDSPFIYFRF